ncbi:TauD/TfdA family dioxygenase [Pseudomonas mosselii]|uniref:TauD/TfdA family dioxygenase n=1 Tax=Pseudomonas mosselii TaxID=78327 RepID=UPI000D93FF1E|nr:TauD/TfdA family dioxygenase [Pseudomonas mosselii]PYC16932.1 taurine catabolism dioxygenase TauD [Pseudomonas mosselii]
MHEWKKQFSLDRSVQVSGSMPDWQGSLVQVDAEVPFLSTFTPARPDIRLAEVFRRHAGWVDEKLAERGALLFRGFEVGGARELELLGQWLGCTPTNSREETSPRTRISGNVFTATEYPGAYPIAFHNESSYQRAMPAKLLFHCVQPSESGGATWLADCRAVWRMLPEAIRSPFARDGYELVRSYHPYFGMSWQQAFGVSDRAAVEAIAACDDIRLEWKDNGVLTTTQRRPCVLAHPRTGMLCWTNHLFFFHHSNLPPHAREALAAEGREHRLINDTRYANGEPVSLDIVTAIGQAYDAHSVSIEWQPGDVLLIDNLSMAHGRAPYAGAGARVIYFSQLDQIEWAKLHHPLRVQEEQT